jgi:hypothetical protein
VLVDVLSPAKTEYTVASDGTLDIVIPADRRRRRPRCSVVQGI